MRQVISFGAVTGLITVAWFIGWPVFIASLLWAPFLAGLIVARPKPGAVNGFLAPFLVVFTLGVLVLVDRFRTEWSSQFTLFTFGLVGGLVFLAYSFFFGGIGAAVGAVGGFIAMSFASDRGTPIAHKPTARPLPAKMAGGAPSLAFGAITSFSLGKVAFVGLPYHQVYPTLRKLEWPTAPACSRELG